MRHCAEDEAVEVAFALSPVQTQQRLPSLQKPRDEEKYVRVR